MEIILVILILGFMAGMVVPFAGHMDEQTRIKKTRQTLETIRAALVGPRGRFDDKGRPVLEGYVGDVGHLPELYAVHWDKDFGENGGWVYKGTADEDKQPANATFAPAVPAGLWLDKLSPLETTYGSVDIPNQKSWEGPYMFEPHDERDNQIYEYDEYEDSETDTDLFESFETDGRLADAWGRNLAVYYTEDNGADKIPDNLYFVSRGPDGKWDETSGVFPHNSTGTDNKDNIVLSVNSNEWASIIEDMKSRTRERLKEIRKALVGDAPAGTNYGYTGHTCRWPDLYNWDDTNDVWNSTNSSTGKSYSIGQPRGLWDWDVIDDMPPDWDNAGMTPFFTRYLEPPVYNDDEPEKDKLKDAWGEEIYLFRDTSNSTVLILSKGPDRKFDFKDHVAASYSEPNDLTGETKEVKIEEQYFDYSSSVDYNNDNIVDWIHKTDLEKPTGSIKFTVTGKSDGGTSYLADNATFYYDSGLKEQMHYLSTDYDSSSGSWVKSIDLAVDLPGTRTGPRYILFWHDENGDGVWNCSQDKGTLITVNVRKHFLEPTVINVDATNFTDLDGKLPR
jgi:type II secretory pathway pseudopilin PulG